MATALLVAIRAGAASAQPAPEPAPAPLGPADSPPPVDAMPPPVDAMPPPPVDAREDAGWLLYHRSFSALAHGDRPGAHALVLQLAHDAPDHPALLRLRDAGFGAELHLDGPAAPTVEKASQTARAELALFQAFHGLSLGIEVDLMLKPDSGAALLLFPLIGTVGGIGVSLLAFDHVTPGLRALANSGTAWGAAETALVLTALPGSTSAERGAAAMMIGTVGGMVGGIALDTLAPTQGQVALANSGGLWTGIVTALSAIVLDIKSEHPAQHLAQVELAATTVGIATGAYFAKLYPEVSRSHTLIIDAGGVAGAVIGFSLGAIAVGNVDNNRLNAGLALGGLALGLFGSTYLTRDWDDTPTTGVASRATAFFAPPTRGAGGVAGIAMPW